MIDYFEPKKDWFPKEIGAAMLNAVTGVEIEKGLRETLLSENSKITSTPLKKNRFLLGTELPTTPHAIPNPVAARIGFEGK